MQPSAVIPHRALPEQVLAFAIRHRLQRHLEEALRLAESVFRPVRELNAELEVDPETNEERIVIDVVVELDVDDVLRRNERYNREWIASAPPEAREKVRLLYNIL